MSVTNDYERVCVIRDLIEKPFSRLTFEEKRKVVDTGRPLPALTSLVSEHKDRSKGSTGTDYT
jgi:hypothetical protein